MQIGIIGLGRMGGNISRRLMAHAHNCVVYDARAEAVAELQKAGAAGASDLRQLVDKLQPPRAVWIMLPAGEITENMIVEVSALLQSGDIVIDGGNSNYRDDIRRAEFTSGKGYSLPRCGDKRWSLGARTGLLHDDRGRARPCAAPRSNIFRTRAWALGHSACGRAGIGRYRRAGLPALRTCGRRPFRQNDP